MQDAKFVPVYRGVAQLGQSARFGTVKSQVRILSPRLKNKVKRLYSPIAQLAEQWIVNPCVAGSNPAGRAYNNFIFR